jgi:hypothetical protein
VTTRVNDFDRVPDLVLEQYRLGELPEALSSRLERRLQQDPDLRARLEAIERSDEEIRRQYPPVWLAGQIRMRAGAAAPTPVEPPRAAWRRWAVPAAVAATVFLVVVLMPRPAGPPTAPEATDRLKGPGPHLAIYHRTAQGSQPLSGGDVLRPGALVRIGYQAAGRRYGVILSIDGRGTVTRHLPAQGPSAAALDRAGLVLLDEAYELDDAPRWEAFYFVTADHAFEVEPVLRAAREASSRGAGVSPPTIALQADFNQAVFVLKKEERP